MRGMARERQGVKEKAAMQSVTALCSLFARRPLGSARPLLLFLEFLELGSCLPHTSMSSVSRGFQEGFQVGFGGEGNGIMDNGIKAGMMDYIITAAPCQRFSGMAQ